MEKSEQQVTLTIGTSARQVWAVIGSGQDVNKWFPQMIESCELKGTTRICGTAHGDIVEEILKIDHENMEFKYAFKSQNIVPNISNLIGSMKVFSDEDGKAIVNWRWTFEAIDEVSANQAREAFKGAGNMGLDGLKNYVINADK